MSLNPNEIIYAHKNNRKSFLLSIKLKRVFGKDSQGCLRKDTFIAIHQPNYFPWAGYFYKIYASEVFVFHDNVEHSKRYPTRRTRIRKAACSDNFCWLTIPLKKHSDFTLIKDLEIAPVHDWQEKHLRKIKNSYSDTPYFDVVFPKIEDWLAESKKYNSLADLNIFLIKKILEWLGIKRQIWRSSELPVEGKGSDYNAALVKYLKGTVYLSGEGGVNYQNEEDLIQQGIRLEYTNFGLVVPVYCQPFIGNSILEVFLRLGLAHTKQMIYGQPIK